MVHSETVTIMFDRKFTQYNWFLSNKSMKHAIILRCLWGTLVPNVSWQVCYKTALIYFICFLGKNFEDFNICYNKFPRWRLLCIAVCSKPKKTKSKTHFGNSYKQLVSY